MRARTSAERRHPDELTLASRCAEEDPSILGSVENPTCVLGFCTGEIPAAIAVAARNTNELYQLSVEAVHIIFRFARDCWRRTVLVDQTNGSWATTLVGVTVGEVQTILDEFHHSQVSNGKFFAFDLLMFCYVLANVSSRVFPLPDRSILDLRPRDG